MSSPTQSTTLPTAAVDVPELHFAHGLPGFPGARRFALVRWGAEGPYSLMVDLDNPDVRFLVMPPFVFFPDYVVDLDDAIAAKIHLDKPEDCLLLVIVTLGASAEEATANLLGPVVINLQTREGMQAVLAESGYSTRVHLRSTTAA
ncbi:MAG: flagellar assembly protein FliW [Mycobacteriales bacterium]